MQTSLGERAPFPAAKGSVCGSGGRWGGQSTVGNLDEAFRGLERGRRRILLETARRRWKNRDLLEQHTTSARP
jgi:hypothetical protein